MRRPALAVDLVRRRVAVIAASGGLATESAAKAMATIPILSVGKVLRLASVALLAFNAGDSALAADLPVKGGPTSSQP